jgi:hypothetical protein
MDSTGAAQPDARPEYRTESVDAGHLGLFVGYYVCYFAGLLIHHQRMLRERPGAGGN